MVLRYHADWLTVWNNLPKACETGISYKICKITFIIRPKAEVHCNSIDFLPEWSCHNREFLARSRDLQNSVCLLIFACVKPMQTKSLSRKVVWVGTLPSGTTIRVCWGTYRCVLCVIRAINSFVFNKSLSGDFKTIYQLQAKIGHFPQKFRRFLSQKT